MINFADLDRHAAERLSPSTVDYISGGAEDESTVRANVAAWKQLEFGPHVLRDVSTVSTATTVLGWPVAMPVLVAPTAMHRLVCDEGELATGRTVSRAGSIYILSMTATTSSEDVVWVPRTRVSSSSDAMTAKERS